MLRCALPVPRLCPIENTVSRDRLSLYHCEPNGRKQETAMNPYLHPVWTTWIRDAHHGGAQALQNLALHLYNSRDWPVNLGYICSLSDDHWEAA